MGGTKSSHKGWLVLALVLVAGALAFYFRPEPASVPAAAVRRPIIAVLIFDNLNEQTELDFLANALTRESIAKLGQMSQGRFDVVAYNSVATYRDTRKTLHQIARELDIDYVLEGGVRQDGSALQLNARLTRVSDQAKMWSVDYDRPLADTFQIQNDLIARICSTLKLDVDPSGLEAMNRASTANPAARLAYFRGIDQCLSEIEGELKRCIASFEAAIKSDPRYPLAHVALAAAQLRAGSNTQVVENHIRQALAVTDAIPSAHVVLGRLKGAEGEFRKALALNPSDSDAALQYAIFLMEKNRLEEATTQVQRGLQLDPSSIDAAVTAGRISIAGKLYDRGIAQLEKAVGMDRNNPEIRSYLAAGYLAGNRNDEAIREFQRAIAFGPGVPEYVAALGEAYVASNRLEEAKTQLNLLKQMSRTQPVSPELIERLSRHINPA